ncbi:hypothetical protein FDP41_008420 [Naegleria fowleri]|uniref:non-specific serine/threonine protein kinase n=1 Tax=Naegleria fowleri TaxID=5763 RepID=A0A6A5B1W1_NAEFO|nr:uncharacterized protein FDP41_008420 [Naegleria fowleri]KAF0973213.1 hypothetical protein FDP41_008420 [Naegleria fowleri]
MTQSSPTTTTTTTTTHPHYYHHNHYHQPSSSNTTTPTTPTTTTTITNTTTLTTTSVTTFLAPPSSSSSSSSHFNISRKQHNLYTNKKKALTLINNTPLIKVPYIEIYLKQATNIYERVSMSSSSSSMTTTMTSGSSSEGMNMSQQSSSALSTTTTPPSSPNTYVVFICSIPTQTLSEFDSTNYNSSGSNNVRGYNRRVLKSNAIRMANPVWNELFIFDIHVSNHSPSLNPSSTNIQSQQQQSIMSSSQQQQQQQSIMSSSQQSSSLIPSSSSSSTTNTQSQQQSSSSLIPSSQSSSQQRIIHETILIQVWAKHIFKTDELLGCKTISLQSLVRNRENQMTLHLSGMSHAQCQIELSLIIHDSLDSQMNVNQIGNEMTSHHGGHGHGTTTTTTMNSNTSGQSGGGDYTTTTTPHVSPGGISSNSSNSSFDFFDSTFTSSNLSHLILPENTLIQNGRYRILQYISNQASKGGDSMIYKIIDHKQLNRIKILKKIKCETIQNANDAIRESWPLSELKHPNLIPYEDMFIDITTNDVLGSVFFVCYVTPFYEEGSLYDFMVKVKKKNIYLTPRRVSDYALQIAQGMEFLHAHSIMHRNLKPSNIYLLENNTALKIGDFGFSKSISHASTILGGVTKIANFGYTAPEIALVTEVTNVYGFEVDIWSFGIILYELLTLKIDKEQLNHCALASFQYDNYIKNVIEGEIRKIYRNDADDFIQLLKRILVLDPSQRMNAKEIVSELKMLVEKFANLMNQKTH